MRLPVDRYYVHDRGPGNNLRWLGDCEIDERWFVADRMALGGGGWLFTGRKQAREKCMQENVAWLASVIRLARKVDPRGVAVLPTKD